MRLREPWSAAALAAICAAAATLVVLLGQQLSFFNDDWYVLLQRPGLASRPGLDSLLQAHNGNIVVLFVAVYRAMGWLFGLTSQLPYRIWLGLTVAALGVVVYLIVRSRLGQVAGLVCAGVVVFLGPAWEALLFFAGFGDFASVALGLGAFWLLERDTPRRNALACLSLVLAVLTFSIGVPFVFGAAIVIALRRRAGQLWIPAVPALLFGGWWLAYGIGQPSHVSVSNLEHLPRYVLDSCSAGLAAIVGLDSGSVGSTLWAGHVVLAVLLALGILVVIRRGPPRAWLLVYAATALSFWLLSGANYALGREPTASRYVVFDAPLAIVMIAELFRGLTPGRWVRPLLVAGGVWVIAMNTGPLENGFDFMQLHASYAKADLGALQLLGGESTSQQQLLAPIAQDPYLSGVTPNRYFEVTEGLGSPAYFSLKQLAGAPPGERAAADSLLVNLGAITLRVLRSAPLRGCSRLPVPAHGAGAPQPLPSGRAVIRNDSAVPLVVDVRRFGASLHPSAFLAPRQSVLLLVRPDRAPLPWWVTLADPGSAGAAVSICDGTTVG